MNTGTVIVYVHGLWQRGAESLWLRRRLAHDLDADTRTFSYPSVAADTTTDVEIDLVPSKEKTIKVSGNKTTVFELQH